MFCVPRLFSCITVFFLALIMPGCVPYHKIIKSEFPQGSDHIKDQVIVNHHLRSTRLYHQFQTCARFDALWLSDEMRSCYVDLYARRRGLSLEEKDALLLRQLEENKHWVSFYLLADIRDLTHTSMSEKNTAWTVYLQVDDITNIQPISIKEVELEPEYQHFFARHRFNLSKVPYLIKFPAIDFQGNRYDSCSTLTLVINSTSKYEKLVWTTKYEPSDTEADDEDFYWV